MNAFERYLMGIGPIQGTVIAILVVALAMGLNVVVTRIIPAQARRSCVNLLVRVACLTVAVLATWVVVRALREGEIRWFSRFSRGDSIRRDESPVLFWLNTGVTVMFGIAGLRKAVLPEPNQTAPRDEEAGQPGAE